MPEGPEVWILSEAINFYYGSNITNVTGKHLLLSLDGKQQTWTFGLNGTVNISLEDDKLRKCASGWLPGDVTEGSHIFFQCDWLKSSKEELTNEINLWKKSKKKLGPLMLEQQRIAGIGVAWGSEILFEAGLRPDMKACDQNLNKLCDSMIDTRNRITETYKKYLSNYVNNKEDLAKFINDWFTNLYEIREMKIYKKGSNVEVGGRKWWV